MVIGSDVPDYNENLMIEAYDLLESDGVVIGSSYTNHDNVMTSDCNVATTLLTGNI